LKGEGKERSAIFFKMLQKLPLGHFLREPVEEKATKLLSALKDSPLEVSGQDVEVEIIPYENLWILILDQLE
jgi:hypothetical protein